MSPQLGLNLSVTKQITLYEVVYLRISEMMDRQFYAWFNGLPVVGGTFPIEVPIAARIKQTSDRIMQMSPMAKPSLPRMMAAILG